jgi:hypothetical protein
MKRALRIIKRIMIITGALILLLAAVIFFYMRQPQFGKTPSGERLARIERSPHYKNGRFHNLVRMACSPHQLVAGAPLVERVT